MLKIIFVLLTTISISLFFVVYFLFLKVNPNQTKFDPLVARQGNVALWVEKDQSLLQNPQYTFTFSIDGSTPTQYCGSPEGMSYEVPMNIKWVSNSSVEIKYTNGKKYILSFDVTKMNAAKVAHKFHYYVDPKFEQENN